MPDGEEIPLTKFAPMGSACCFPVEALVFWALSNVAQSDHVEDKAFKRLFYSYSSQSSGLGLTAGEPTRISVFGDDIIVRVEQVDRTVALLEAVGLKVNASKSFTKGPFRESCGGDYLAGSDVAPVRVKHRLLGDNIGTVFRFIDLCNNLSLKFGSCDPMFVKKLRELFQRFFGFLPELVAVNHREGAGACVLYDYHWLQNEQGMTPKLYKKSSKGGSVTWVPANVRKRKSVKDRSKTDYCQLERLILTEVADEVTRDLGWCSVLRSFRISGGRGGTHKYSFRKRVRYKLAWLKV